MAVSGKHLFWLSIIILELVLVYLLWKPYHDRFLRPTHRAAVTRPADRRPATRTPAPQTHPETSGLPETKSLPGSKALPGTKSVPETRTSAETKPPALAAKPAAPAKPNLAPSPAQPKALAAAPAHPKPSPFHVRVQKRAPVVNAGLKTREPLSPKPALALSPSATPLDSFWCRISMIESTCDCKLKADERSANPLLP
jgi:hypothetical protein